MQICMYIFTIILRDRYQYFCVVVQLKELNLSHDKQSGTNVQ